MLRAFERGLTIADFEHMTIGMIVDYISTYNKYNGQNEDETEREATQADFDAF